MEGRPKIGIVRVPSNERSNFRSLDGIRSSYGHIRVGTYGPEPEVKVVVCDGKPPIEQTRKFKKNLGPVSKLLRRRHHTTYLATKSCDNIYSVNRSSGSLDWRVSQTANDQGFQSRQSGSLDWRVGRSVNKLHWRDTTRSAEQLSRSGAISSDHLQTPSTKSKLISLLRRLSPRISRPGSKHSLQSSPTICPWVQVEYSSESINDGARDDPQESDASFQRELQLNELRKRMAGIPTTSQVTANIVSDGKEQQSSPQPKIQVRPPETDHNCACKSVHEDHGNEDRRRASGQTHVGGEVAGLEDVGDTCVATLTPSVPGAGGIRSNRRPRPLSLAVQPLNYRRLDPDPQISIDVVTSRHPKMTSQESIGSCSLDVDQSASDRSETTVDSVSKKTLHSLNLSCNGGSVSSSGKLANGSSETLQKSQLTPDEKLNVSNGHRGSAEPEQLTVKKPSYLGLACSISGYSGLNRYDSKLREGFRSRDSSPGTRLITRDTSPAGFRSNESLNVPAHPYPPKSQSISPLAMDRQNGFSNGLKEDCKVEAYRESRSSISICQGYSEVDKGVMHSTFPDLSPIRSSTPGKLSPGMMSCSQQNKSFTSHFSGSSPKPAIANLSNTSFSDTSILNGSSVEVESQTLNISSSSEKSFIQQRVERLYGPGALAQGFFFKRSTSRLNASESSFNKSSNNNDVSADNANAEESLKNLPVLRHLRPEFRAQLPVVSPRRPTDGSEQILKPLQRVTPVSRKTEQKPKIQSPSSLEGKTVEGKMQKLNSSTASIPDQQPAAPKVVLPVLEPSASATNVAKLALEAEKAAEEKDGHYFVKLLKQETGRLLTLAASVEAELVSDTVALPEEAAGKLRSAAGKARLLASQKMQQFEGLCQKNINQVPGEEFPTTNEDLAGFWDMVMLQVVQVNDLFDQIEKLRNSQWQEVCSVSLHPQTPPSPKRTQRKFPSRRSFHDMKPLQKPSRLPSTHFLNDNRARLHTETFNEPEKLVPSKTSSSYATEMFPLEMRLCDDAFCGLTNLQDLEDSEASCDGETRDLGCEDSNPFPFESVNEIETLGSNVPLGNPCTRYVVNYVDVLQPSFRLEELGRRSYSLFPREDFFEHGVGRHRSREKAKLEVIFKKETDEAGRRNVTVDSFSNRSQKTGNNISELPATGKSSKDCVNRALSPSKKKWSGERKRENVRGKAKSCSPIGRAIKNEIKDRRRTRSRTPESRLQKVNPFKSNAGDQYKSRTPRVVSSRKMDEGKAPRPRISSKLPFKYISPPRPVACKETKKRNAKKLGCSVTFVDNVKETTLSSKRISSGDCIAEKTQKFVNVFHGNSKRKTWMLKQSTDKESLPSYNQTKVQAPRIKENREKNASKANAKDVDKGNLSVMSEEGSNLESLNNKRKFHGRPEGPVENCTTNKTWTKKKQEKTKDPPKKVEQESKDSLEVSDNICWRLSDSKPFIPISQEALRQLRLVYNTQNQVNLSALLNKSEKLERMRLYDKKRKRISKNREDEPPRKLISRGTTPNMSEDNLANPVGIRGIRSLNFYDTNIASGITSFINDRHDISVECLITPRVMNSQNKSTLVLNNITSSITKWPERNVEIEELLSSLISSLSPEIVSRVPNSSSTKLKNRVSIKKLSYGLIAESFATSDVNGSLVVDISQHVHSDFTVEPLRDRKSGKSGKSVNFYKYLPWKRELNVARCLEDLKHVQLYPENSKACSNPFDSKRLPARVKHACRFVRSNRTLCRLSLYLYMYGILSLVLIFLKIGSCSHCFLDPRVLYKSF